MTTVVTRQQTTTVVDANSRTSLALNLTRGGTVVINSVDNGRTIGVDSILLDGIDGANTIAKTQSISIV